MEIVKIEKCDIFGNFQTLCESVIALVVLHI